MNLPKFIARDSFYVVGLAIETKNEIEMTENRKIPEVWETYYKEQMSEKILNKQVPEVTIALYSNYESNENGTYTYAVGVPVDKIAHVPENMTTFNIPASEYAVFTTRKGKLSEVIPEAWEYIWKWSKENKRKFTTDFELYDERSIDPNNSQVDIYIAIG
ncbi:GyrI-like domain-containing protein [Ectobacillus panaciterrae]|uniref:GyrI-like domain-containing protein n=1 Tax=Ectobacillus panaciterrae TaxID=363872 RepID=UPI0004211091|nr:GyrI-like domain-containing protein [Ectobacillus panaciterrae]